MSTEEHTKLIARLLDHANAMHQQFYEMTQERDRKTDEQIGRITAAQERSSAAVERLSEKMIEHNKVQVLHEERMINLMEDIKETNTNLNQHKKETDRRLENQDEKLKKLDRDFVQKSVGYDAAKWVVMTVMGAFLAGAALVIVNNLNSANNLQTQQETKK